MVPSNAVPVDSVSFLFLVDNTIEWYVWLLSIKAPPPRLTVVFPNGSFRMTRLPPGFSQEIINHLTNGPPVDKLTGVPYVDLDNYCCG